MVQEHHDTPYVGHLDRDKTLELVKGRFYWPGMGEYVARYVRTCSTCKATKPSKRSPSGLLQPLAKEGLGPWE